MTHHEFVLLALIDALLRRNGGAIRLHRLDFEDSMRRVDIGAVSLDIDLDKDAGQVVCRLQTEERERLRSMFEEAPPKFSEEAKSIAHSLGIKL